MMHEGYGKAIPCAIEWSRRCLRRTVVLDHGQARRSVGADRLAVDGAMGELHLREGRDLTRKAPDEEVGSEILRAARSGLGSAQVAGDVVDGGAGLRGRCRSGVGDGVSWDRCD